MSDPKLVRLQAAIGRLSMWLLANTPEGLSEGGAIENAIAYMDRLRPPKHSVRIDIPQGEFIGALTALEWVLTRDLVPVDEGRDELWAVRKILRTIKRQQKGGAT